MPIFSRRRLQTMLDDLGPLLTEVKARDLLPRLEHKNTQAALSTEVELGLLWAISQVAELEIEPDFPGKRSKIDALSKNLFPQGSTAIEITALSDDTFSGKVDMDRAANIIVQFAKTLRKEADKHLYFEFAERSYYDRDGFKRVRSITPDFKLTPEISESLTQWLDCNESPAVGQRLRVTDEQIDVVISWRQGVHRLFRTHCSMPPVTYDLEDNPIYKALKKKEQQLSAAPAGVLKCVFLGDAGCSNLRSLKPLNAAGREIGGEQIILHFLRKSKVDAVCVFSPVRPLQMAFGGQQKPRWQVSFYSRENWPDGGLTTLQALAGRLPAPRLEGYQARSWHQQGMFDPQGRGQYLGTFMTGNFMSTSIKVSARLVLEVLAGRVTPQQFKNSTFGEERNLLESTLANGMMLQSVRIEKAGIDEDDDYFVLDFDFDAAASPLRQPKARAGSSTTS